MNLYVTDIDKPPLLGREWLRQIGIQLDNVLDVAQINARLDNMLDKYSTVFNKDMGKIVGLPASLKLKPNTQPFFMKARKVSHALLPKVEEELLRLEKEGVLEKVNTYFRIRDTYRASPEGGWQNSNMR